MHARVRAKDEKLKRKKCEKSKIIYKKKTRYLKFVATNVRLEKTTKYNFRKVFNFELLNFNKNFELVIF